MAQFEVIVKLDNDAKSPPEEIGKLIAMLGVRTLTLCTERRRSSNRASSHQRFEITRLAWRARWVARRPATSVHFARSAHTPERHSGPRMAIGRGEPIQIELLGRPSDKVQGIFGGTNQLGIGLGQLF